MNKICVTAIYNDAYKEMANITFANFRKYCLIHNYIFEPIKIPNNVERTPHWEKVIAVKNLLLSNKYDWIFFIDTDCLFMNTVIKIEDFINEKYFMIIPGIDDIPEPKILNNHGTTAILNAQFLIKNCQQSIDFLSNVWNAEETKDKYFIFDHENRQFRISADKKEFKNDIKIIDLRQFNSFWYSNDPFFLLGNPHYNERCWKPDDFIVHVVQGIGHERIECLKNLIHFSGGAFVDYKFKPDRINLTPLYELNNITFFIKSLDGNNIINYNLKEAIPTYSYDLFLTTEMNSLKIEGYNNKKELISSYIITKNE
jgi:hypothetical protein